MNWLKTTRVAVVDDSETEALPLLKVLSDQGVGALYFDAADPQSYPNLEGIRLLFLDMHLSRAGTSTRAHLDTLYSHVTALLSKENGPYVLVGWTKHTELVEKFALELSLRSPELTPVACLSWEKPGTTGIKIDHFWSKLENVPAIRFLFAWEQSAHEATTKTFGQMYDLSARLPSAEALAAAIASVDELSDAEVSASLLQRIRNRGNQFFGLLTALTWASAGKSVTPATAQQALGETLNILLGDSLEERLLAAATVWAPSKTKLKEEPRKALKNSDVVSKTNAFLLTGTPRSGLPGNVYTETTWPGQWPFGEDEAANINTNELLSQCWPEDETARLENLIPVLIDITPACDCAQDKVTSVRVIAGFLVPTTETAPPRSQTNYLAQLGPFELKISSGAPIKNYNLLVHVGQLRTYLPRDLEGNNAIIRLRESVVFALQSQFAAHSGRPGFVSLTPITN